MTTNNSNQTFSVIATTNGYIASRDLMFNGSPRIVLASGLSLEEAREKLLTLWNERVDDDYQADTIEEAAELSSSRLDRMEERGGLPSFEFDSRVFTIEPDAE